MGTHTLQHRAHRGHTLLELIIVLALLGAIVGTAIGSIVAAQWLVGRDTARWHVEGDAHLALAFIGERLRQSGTDADAEMTLLDPHPDGGFRRIRFRMNEGVDPTTGDIFWGQFRELGFAHQLGEVSGGTPLAVTTTTTVHGVLGGSADDVDQDGDGLVDEGVLYYRSVRPDGAAVIKIIAVDVLASSRFRLRSDAAASTPSPGEDAVIVRIELAQRDPSARASGTIVDDESLFLRGAIERVITPLNFAP
jgi:hypothetical protein